MCHAILIYYSAIINSIPKIKRKFYQYSNNVCVIHEHLCEKRFARTHDFIVNKESPDHTANL